MTEAYPGSSSDGETAPFLINGRSYRRPGRPVVVICFDGCDPAYVTAAMAAGVVPNLARMMEEGFNAVAQAAMPTFTNPNNVAIACGAPPAVTGVAGNYYLDRATGREIMVLDGHQMRVDTVFAHFAAAGLEVAVVTAKDKLLRALARNMEGIALSAESPDGAAAILGDAAPPPAADKYSEALSLYVLDVGVQLLAAGRASVLYLSLSDYVQHKHAPEAPEALAFMAAVDQRLGRLVELGAIVGIVADHGMSDMSAENGTPRITYVQDELEARFGAGAVRVICPITDPFVRHHASLGGFVRVYIKDPALSPEQVRSVLDGVDGVALALPAEAACARFDLPLEGEADVVVVAQPGVALGATRNEHDLSALAGRRLRSHGGLNERNVPFILSHPLTADYAARAGGGLHNYDIFDFAINGVAKISAPACALARKEIPHPRICRERVRLLDQIRRLDLDPLSSPLGRDQKPEPGMARRRLARLDADDHEQGEVGISLKLEAEPAVRVRQRQHEDHREEACRYE